MSTTVLFDTAALQVGDLWPQKMFQRHGPIIAIKPYDGDPQLAYQAEITGIAVFGDGVQISIGGIIPAPADLVAQTQAHKENTAMTRPTRPGNVPDHAFFEAGNWRTYDGPDDDGLPMFTSYCRDCGEALTGCSWSGRCRSCHESQLLPVPFDGLDDTGETWSDLHIGQRHREGM